MRVLRSPLRSGLRGRLLGPAELSQPDGAIMLNPIKPPPSNPKTGTTKFDTFTKHNQGGCPERSHQSTAIIGCTNVLPQKGPCDGHQA